MLHDVDETLRTIVTRDVTNGSNVEISFEAPNKDWAARRQGPTVSLYLYEVRENLERRQRMYQDMRDEIGMVKARLQPPRIYRLEYLVTAWTQRPEDEHRLLSSVLEAFLRFDALPEDVLAGSLVDAPVAVRSTIGLPLPQDRSISDVWSALGGELKASLNLIIEAPFGKPRADLPLGPPVREFPVLSVADAERSELVRARIGKPAPGEPGSDILAVPLAAETVRGGLFAHGSAARAGEALVPAAVDARDADATGDDGQPGSSAGKKKGRGRRKAGETDGDAPTTDRDDAGTPDDRPGRRLTVRELPRQPR